MSRIAKQIIKLPEKVKCSQIDDYILCEGPMGSLKVGLVSGFSLRNANNECSVVKGELGTSAMHGTIVANLKNAINGVHKKFQKEVMLNGVGYKASKNGNMLELSLGYSHKVNFSIPEGIDVELLKPTEMIVKSVDNVLLGDFCARLAKTRKVEPYKGKGVIIKGQFVLRKEGKRK